MAELTDEFDEESHEEDNEIVEEKEIAQHAAVPVSVPPATWRVLVQFI